MSDGERLRPEDLALLNKAKEGVTSAQAVLQFTIGHLWAVYGMGDKDYIQPDGTILRVPLAQPGPP